MFRLLLVVLSASSFGYVQAKSPPESARPVPPNSAGIGLQLPDFTTKTHDGKAFQLSTAMNGKKGYVLAVTSTSCPLSKKYLPTLRKLEAQFAEEKIGFAYVNPIATDEPKREESLPGIYIHDQTGTIASRSAPARQRK